MCDTELTARALQATSKLGSRIKTDMRLCYVAAGMLIALSILLFHMLEPVLTAGSVGLRMLA
jgi:hypothetical protein